MSLRSARALVLVIAAMAVPALAAPSPPPVFAPLLPAAFARWKESARPRVLTAAAALNTPNVPDSSAPHSNAPDSSAPDANVLREYGLQESDSATYRNNGRHLTLRALRFADATGAYGAFTFYRQPPMHAVPLGKGGASQGPRFLFWTGATLVDATFAPAGAGDQAALEQLVALLPVPPGPEANPPTLPRYLPPQGLAPETVRYAIGPAAYARSGGVLPPEIVHFDQDAEAVTAQYGRGTLTLLTYPTPQIAQLRAQAMDSLLKSGTIPGAPGALLERRVGPLVAITSGDLPAATARNLLGQIHSNDVITIDRPQGYVSEITKTARLLMGIAVLTGILVSAALILGLFLGGGRALVRVLRGKTASTLNDEEFISLRLGG